jgi:hypothetical protein
VWRRTALRPGSSPPDTAGSRPTAAHSTSGP